VHNNLKKNKILSSLHELRNRRKRHFNNIYLAKYSSIFLKSNLKIMFLLSNNNNNIIINYILNNNNFKTNNTKLIIIIIFYFILILIIGKTII